ncbi:hypothetical protein CGJ94_26255 [Vibrio parahaemolyticus]|nr:hypothetical protein CGK06_11185 [Vibrio parahaemolyticus]TOB93786.1 hypothetical protein CGJ94_26255 [Vibrio parahaemolyticus]
MFKVVCRGFCIALLTP